MESLTPGSLLHFARAFLLLMALISRDLENVGLRDTLIIFIEFFHNLFVKFVLEIEVVSLPFRDGEITPGLFV